MIDLKPTQDTPSEEALAYRDKIATVDQKGKRIWIYPKQPKGRFYSYRKGVSYLLLLVLFGLPFIKVNGLPLMLFNIPEAQFILFGIYFTPQDFHLFVIAMLISIIAIALFTAVYGRLFCGWICPQTIFMEMVFRRIEYWIEGDANAQRRLARAPWTTDKIVKKVSKQLLFILISILIAHTFLSYIIGADEVWNIVNEPIRENWQGFTAMVVFTAVFYGVFSIMREQVCTTICPYGRMQGVLVDENALAVSYDFVRGEPRGKLVKPKKQKRSNCKNGCSDCKNGNSSCPSENIIAKINEAVQIPKGDCVDCKLCIQVCPTGIDIRDGIQLECINCTACMDACDEVMTKIKRPTGLIRIDSYNGILKGKQKLITPRIIAYTAVLVALIGLESFLLFSRSQVETLFLRTPGLLYQEQEEGVISNLYNYQLINKTDKVLPIEIKIVDREDVKVEWVGKAPSTKSREVSEGAVFFKIPKANLNNRKTELDIEVYSDGQLIDRATTTFLGPVK